MFGHDLYHFSAHSKDMKKISHKNNQKEWIQEKQFADIFRSTGN